MESDDGTPREGGERGEDAEPRVERRRFLENASTIAMAGGLVGGYGAFAAMAGRFLYPARGLETAWMFVARCREIGDGAVMFRTPAGASITVTRQGPGEDAADFLALSSTCPHLGCRVHWEPHNDRFFCPCHNGVFDPQGNPREGPPADAGQTLPRYPLRVEGGLLFIEIPVEGVEAEGTDSAT